MASGASIPRFSTMAYPVAYPCHRPALKESASQGSCKR
jgi:hypothetical protein